MLCGMSSPSISIPAVVDEVQQTLDARGKWSALRSDLSVVYEPAPTTPTSLRVRFTTHSCVPAGVVTHNDCVAQLTRECSGFHLQFDMEM